MWSEADGDKSAGGDRTNPVPPRWKITERTSRDWREAGESDKLSEDKKD